jgi:maleate cis-trans isomerase
MSSTYKVRNVAKQKLRGYHVRNEVARSNDEYIKEQGFEVSNKFDALAIPANGMMSVDPVLTRVSKKDVLAGKKKTMIMSINDLADEESKEAGKEQSQSSIAPPVQSSFRQYTGKPVNIQNKGPKYEMKITLFNKGFERDMM